MIDLFRYEEPATYLRDLIDTNHTIRGYITKLASAAGCQVSYFSQFLRGKSYLSPDHAVGISEFLGHSNLESEYFLSLILLSRAATPKLKQILEKKIDDLRVKNSSLSERIESQNDVGVAIQRYYSSWLYAAIHVALSISKLETIASLAERFDTTNEKVLEILSALESMNLICKKEGKWVLVTPDVHLHQNSEMTFMNHFLWRQRALLNIDKEKSGSVHYSSVFAMSEKDAVKIKGQILDFVDHLRSNIKDSPSEEVFCLNMDFFKV